MSGFPAAGGTAPRGGVHHRRDSRFSHPSPADAGHRPRAPAARSGCDRRALDNFLIFALLSGQFVEVRIRLGVFGIHFIQTFQRVNHFGYRFFNGFTYGVFRVQLRFLRQVADLDAGCGRASPSMSVSMPAMMRSRVDLPAPLRPSTPILRPGRSSARYFKNMTFRRDNFADTMHGINELSHVDFASLS